MIDFEIPADLAARRDEIRAFVAEEIVPFERDPRLTRHGPNEEMRTEMVELARKAGLLTVQAPRRFGGWEPTHRDQAVLFEAAGWSTLGPVAMNCAAPDEGNMFILSKIANEAQSEEFLVPVIDGRQRSVFAMTEPDGAGSDPGQLKTEAIFDGSEYVINGRKWLITGADGARTWIIMARVAPNPHGADGPTLFLCDGRTHGIELERVMNTMDRNYVQGHGVVRFDNLRLPASAVLGEVGQALRYAQMRLAPARLTHCMRWLGAAERAQSIAVEHARTRTAFGKPLGEHQGVGFMLADNEIALQQCRLGVWWACWTLDSGAKEIGRASCRERVYSKV
jgi:acyl-CoA dehydrogenase